MSQSTDDRRIDGELEKRADNRHRRLWLAESSGRELRARSTAVPSV